MKKFLLAVSVLLIFLAPSIGLATTIDVLWYGGSDSYNSDMTALASGAGSWDPLGDGALDWNLTFWNAGDDPDFFAYDVLVIGSPDDGFGTGMDPARLLTAGSDIAAARGSRTFLSGQDADWHARYGLTAAQGFIYNAVNWASSGTGLGIVSMTDGWASIGSQWWTMDGSFLQAELSGYTDYFQDESVVIPSGMESYPVNEGLTTASLSNWGTSSHSGFDKSIAGYTSINDAGSRDGWAVTIVTEGAAGGDTSGGDTDDTGSVPEPGTMFLIGSGILGLGLIRRRVK